MGDRSGDACALLGMDGFVVLTQTEEDGELFVLVETTAEVVGCRRCGVRASGHGRSVVQVRDLPMGGRPVRLCWRKRRWLCTDADCDATSFTEESPEVEGSLTRRAAAEICRRVGHDGHSVAQVARDFGVGWTTAMGCVRRHGDGAHRNSPESLNESPHPGTRWTGLFGQMLRDVTSPLQ